MTNTGITNMRQIVLAAAVVGVAVLSGLPRPAGAQSATRSVVGEWLYDANGELVGSVYGASNDGRTVIVQYGSYLTPGRHLVALPASDVVIVGERATLRTLTADALRDRVSVD